jgi:hypothetical protein
MAGHKFSTDKGDVGLGPDFGLYFSEKKGVFFIAQECLKHHFLAE